MTETQFRDASAAIQQGRWYLVSDIMRGALPGVRAATPAPVRDTSIVDRIRAKVDAGPPQSHAERETDRRRQVADALAKTIARDTHATEWGQRQTSWHESAHCVTASVLWGTYAVKGLRLSAGGETFGEAQIEPPIGARDTDRLVMLAAGSCGVALLNRTQSVGTIGGFGRPRYTPTRSYGIGGDLDMASRIIGHHLDEQSPEWSRAHDEALAIVEENVAAVRAVADALLQCRTLCAADFADTLRPFPIGRPRR